MICDPSNSLDVERAKLRFNYLIKRGRPFELTEIKQKRTLSQNNYLHLLLGHFANESGNTIECVKQKYFKILVNPDIFIRQKEDKYLGKVRYIRSSADCDSVELTQAIDKFILWAETEGGTLMPRPGDIDFLNSVEIQMRKNRLYL